MSSIENAVTYPMESDDWVVTVLIGGVLSVLSFLLIPLFIVYGYLVRAIRANFEGKPEPPAFGDWGELTVDGLQVAVIGFVYMLVPIVVMAVTVGGSAVALATGSEAGAAAGAGTLVVGILVTVVLALLFGYFAAVGIVNFAREERFGAAFDFGVVKDVGLDSDFAMPWLISVAVFIAAGLVNVIPVIGALIAVFTNFYALIVASDLWADGFREATDAGSVSGQTGVEETPV